MKLSPFSPMKANGHNYQVFKAIVVTNSVDVVNHTTVRNQTMGFFPDKSVLKNDSVSSTHPNIAITVVPLSSYTILPYITVFATGVLVIALSAAQALGGFATIVAGQLVVIRPIWMFGLEKLVSFVKRDIALISPSPIRGCSFFRI